MFFNLSSLSSQLRGTHIFPGLIVLGWLSVFATCSNAQAISQDLANSAVADEAVEETEEEKEERRVAERFLELLEKRPRPGTALDKVYGYHVQRGSLDEFCLKLQVAANANSGGESWLLVGLVQLQCGRETDALASLQKAEELMPNDAMASYYYGKALARVGSTDRAVEAMNRAIQRRPVKSDLLLVLQDLGRLYQRMGRAKEATDVWKNLEDSFPGDMRVKEQIASILAEEGATAEALVRYENLALNTTDRFHKIELSLWAAQLKESLGRRDDALADFEQLLSQVNPDSWMYQDLRNRIDRVFTSRNEYDALAKYYQRWVDAHPDDIDGMMRIGRLLSNQRRIPEAKEWFSKAIERVPTSSAPRLALVDAYERERQFTLAAQAMRVLVELEPDNLDYIVRLGTLIFADPEIEQAERARSAADVWNKLLVKRGDDELTVSRVADLLRGVKLVEEAISAYRKAIALAENEAQYREYLGEYLFSLERKEEALLVWRELASGPRESRENLVRLSEVLATFHLDEEALLTMGRACQDEPTFDQRIRYTKMLRRAMKYDEAVKQLDLADSEAESPEEHLLVIEQQIETYQANGQLLSKIADLEADVAAADKDNPRSWQRLAMYREADRRFHQSVVAIARAVELSPQSTVLLNIEARVCEKAGLFVEAIESLRKLAAIDRRSMSKYLMQIASLQMRIGQFKAAIATGQELVSGVSANSEHFKFFADLCFSAGENALGLKALRKNLHRNPNDRDALRSLASKLVYSDDSEAIELYWRAYQVSSTIDEKRNDILALTPLYQRRNQLEQLIDRLTHLGRELGDQREATLMVVSARLATGDLRNARTLLDSLVTEESRDVDVLQTLTQLAAAEYDWDAAVRYQRQLNASAPSPEGEMRLANFLTQKGEIDEPLAIWTQLGRETSTPENISQITDLLIKNRHNDKAVEYAQQAIEREPDNWEVLTAAMCAMWRANNSTRAIEVADRLLKVKLPFDTPSTHYQKVSSSKATTAGGQLAASFTRSDLSSRGAALERFLINFQAIVLQSNLRASHQPVTISSFADAQLIASFIKKQGNSFKPLASGGFEMYWNPSKRSIIDIEDLPSVEAIWNYIATDLYALSTLGIDDQDSIPLDTLLKRLVELGDSEAPVLLLQSRLYNRNATTSPQFTNFLRISGLRNSWLFGTYRRASLGGRVQAAVKKTPLASTELQYLTELFEQSIAKTESAEEQVGFLLWFAEEYRIAEREDSALQMVTRAKKLAESKLSMDQLAAFLPFDREFAVKAFVDCISREAVPLASRITTPSTSSSSAYSSYMMSSFLRQLVQTSADPSEILGIWRAIKEAQVAAARTLTPSQLLAYDPNKKLNLYVPAGRGAFLNNAGFTLPAESALQSLGLLSVLHVIQSSGQEDINATDVEEAVAKRLAEDAESVDDDVLSNAVDRLCYATWLWWEGKKNEAIAQMREFRKLGVATEVGTLIESQMLVESYKAEEAIDLLDSLNPTNPRTIEYCELTIMTLALKNGKTDRAKTAVERLFAMPLNAPTQLRVSAAMEQLGLKEMSDTVLERLRRGGANDLPTLFKVMTKLSKSESQVDKVAAVELAWKIYQRTQPTTQSAAQAVPSFPQTAGVEFRSSTVRLLVESGETDRLITSLEERLARSPKNEPLIHQLAELYRETGKATQADQMLKPYMKENIFQSVSSPQLSQHELEEQAIVKEVMTRVVVLSESMSKSSSDAEAAIKRITTELFQTTSDSRLGPINAKVANALLGTEMVDWRNSRGKFQEWLARTVAANDGKEKLEAFLKQTSKPGTKEWQVPQLVILVCIADAVGDKEATRQIAQSIVSHSNAAFSAAALSSPGRETTWAAVPLALKLGDADLAIKLAQIAMKPTADKSNEALQLRFELASLQLDVGKSKDAETTLREIMTELSVPGDKDLEARSNLAMKIATLTASQKALFDISSDATLRASVWGTTGSQKTNENISKLVQWWQKQAPPDRVYETVKEIVFRGGDPNRWRLYPEPGRSYGGSHDFTFPEEDAKPLAFVLVDAAQANQSIPALIQEIDALAEKPGLRTAVLMMKAYAHRALGNTTEAAKLIDDGCENIKSVAEEILLVYALTAPVPGGDSSTVIPHGTAETILKKFLNDRILHTGTRMAMLSQVKRCIATNDRERLDCYVSAFAQAIPKIKSYDEQSLKLMLSQFYKYLAGECTAQGKPELAEKYLALATGN